ncbi:hypothetical protein [Aquirufa novilacunae]|uniref:DUF5683 domain-containing protein n=1 Tax=Aquirufa novilacunae TaxID=3139305 RepID=A0ABW8TXX8_9BACT
MKIRSLLFFLLIASSSAMAQEKRLIPIEEVSGVWSRKFMYNRQLIDHPLALQIPLMEAKDPEINVEFLKFKRQRKLSSWLAGFSTVFAFSTYLSKGSISEGFYWSAVGGVALANVYIGTISNRHFNNALKRYNELSKAQMGIRVGSEGSVGIGITYKLK